MKHHHHSKELEVLEETMKAAPHLTPNTDKAFLALLLYMTFINTNPSITKHQYIDLLSSCSIPHQNSTHIYNGIQHLIQNNNTCDFQMGHEKYIKITHIPKTSTSTTIQCDFMRQYQHKLYVLISGYVVQFYCSRQIELNLLSRCVEYLDELTPKLKSPDNNDINIKSPISALIYLYTNKYIDYFDATLINKACDWRQCEWINAVYPNDTCSLYLKDTVVGYIFVRSLFEKFEIDYRCMNGSTIVDHQQSSHQLSVSLFRYLLIQSISSQKSEPNRWNFFCYFVQFLNENALKIYTKHCNEKHPKGLGLQFLKQICSRFSLKSGPYCRVKKDLNSWCYDKFSPTIYGWWCWYNRTLKRWIKFPKELKGYFRKFNAAYTAMSANQSEYVDAMYCQFKIVGNIKDINAMDDDDAIPITPILPNESVNVTNKYETNNNELFRDYRQIIVHGFIRKLSLKYNTYEPSVAYFIDDYLKNNKTQNVKRKDPPKNPLSLLCYLYHEEEEINSVILGMNISKQRTLLKTHSLLNQIGEKKRFFAGLLKQYYYDIQWLNNTKNKYQWTTKQICLSLFNEIIEKNVAKRSTERDQYQFFIFFCRYMEEHNITMETFWEKFNIKHLSVNCSSNIVRIICEYYGAPTKRYKTMHQIISSWLGLFI